MLLQAVTRSAGSKRPSSCDCGQDDGWAYSGRRRADGDVSQNDQPADTQMRGLLSGAVSDLAELRQATTAWTLKSFHAPARPTP